MARKRPINAELPTAPDESSPRSGPASASEIDHAGRGSKSDARRRRGRRPIPGALKGIGVLVAFAVVFLLAAVLGGGGSSEESGETAPAPASEAPAEGSETTQTPTAEAAETLGYPSFATNNTTRVGGSDPAEIAAAVSLAVFPSSTAAQRPAAVAIVDEGDWQGAVAASVLMAEPVRAPLLVSSGGDLPDASSQALAALDPQGSKATGGVQAFAVGDAATPDGLKTTKVSGDNAAALAASIAGLRERLVGTPEHIVLASESEPEFALPAAAWAARSGNPVLFTETDKLPAATAKALRAHPKTPVYVLGPSSAVSSDVFREVAKVAGQVRRVAGKTPVENAIALARYASGGFGWNVNDPGHGFVVARDDEPLAAAVSSPLSASGTWGPLLLTDDAATLAKPLREYMLDVKPGYTTDPTRAFYNHVWVIGDQEAIDVNQQAEMNQLAELAKIGGQGTVSEAETPDLLGAGHRVTAEDIRALAGASTPHFALQVRNRIRRLIEPLPTDDPARREGERKIAELEDLAEHSGDPRGTMGIARHG